MQMKQNGTKLSRNDLRTSHKEADIIIANQIIHISTFQPTAVRIICDDTDVFVILMYFYFILEFKFELTMESLRKDRAVINIGDSIEKHKDITLGLLAFHALSGCDTVAGIYGI